MDREIEFQSSVFKGLVIFDLDGTLLNTIADLGTACNVALQAGGYPTHPLEEYPRYVGNGVNRLICRALPPELTDQQREAAMWKIKPAFIAYYNEHNRVFTHPYEGIMEVLQTLKAQKYALAVTSNKYQQAAEVIVNHYFTGLFDLVLGEREGYPRKPDPAIVNEAIQKIQEFQRYRCSRVPESNSLKVMDFETMEQGTLKLLYVGDSDVDMQTAKNAGIPSIACTWGFCTREQLDAIGYDYIAHTPKEILSFIS